MTAKPFSILACSILGDDVNQAKKSIPFEFQAPESLRLASVERSLCKHQESCISRNGQGT